MSNRERLAYDARTHAENQLANGYNLLVSAQYPHPEDVDDDRMTNLLMACQHAVEARDVKSIYVVGFGLGELLVNLRLLLGDDIKLGGCEQSDMFISFGQNLFDLAKYNLNLEVNEPPYHEIPEADLIISLDYLTDTPEGRDTLVMMQKSKLLIVCEKEMQKYLDGEVAINETKSVKTIQGKRVEVSTFKFDFNGNEKKEIRGQRANDLIADDWTGTDDE